MPIHEYICHDCKNEFEELVFSSDKPVLCPACGSIKTEKLISACRAKVNRSGLNLDALQDSSCGSGGG